MHNIDFVNMHRYQDIERVVYQKVIEWGPSVIVELGHGSGAITAAMGLALKEVNKTGKIFSYDINGTAEYALSSVSKSALTNIEERSLTDMVKFIKGDVFDTWVNSPFTFDLLVIDIDNTWDMIYNIVIKNAFIQSCINSGAKVLIEGGDPNHPRINPNTLTTFNNSKGEDVFKLNHIAGSGRTSISILEI